MRIRMLQTIRGSRDGVNVESFEAGTEYDFIEEGREGELVAVFLRERWAEKPKARVQPEIAAMSAAPENEARRPGSRRKP